MLDDAVRWFGETVEAHRYRYDQKTGQMIEDRIERILYPPQKRPALDLNKPENLVMSDERLRAFESLFM